MANRLGGEGWRKHWQILFSWAPKSLQTVTAPMKLKDVCSLEKSHEKPRQHIQNSKKHIQKPRHYFADKGPYNQSYGFSSGQIWM